MECGTFYTVSDEIHINIEYCVVHTRSTRVSIVNESVEFNIKKFLLKTTFVYTKYIRKMRRWLKKELERDRLQNREREKYILN